MNSENDIDYMKVDSIQDDCDPKSCFDCRILLDIKRIRQEKTGICWFASLIHIFNWSDSFRKKKIKKTKSLETALKELNELANKPCTKNFYELSLVNFFVRNPVTYHEERENNILYEYFSPNGSFFCDATPTSGGFPINYLMPYLVTIGYEPTSIKHVISNLDKVRLLYDEKDDRNPRKTKYMRVLSDYLRELIVYKPRGIVETTDVFTFTFLQQYKYLDNLIDRTLLLGKYIMFIHEKFIQVFKLDAMILISLNNHKRGSGHAICAISCNKEGYILNTYDQDDYITAGNNDCGLFKYDWYKWNPYDMFSHSFNDTYQCTAGKIEGIYEIQTRAGQSLSDAVNDETNKYYYHRNIGDNSFLYVRQADMIINDKIKNEYNKFIQQRAYFDLYVLPYFLYFTNITKIFLTEITYEYLVSIKSNLSQLINGIGYDPDVKTNKNWGYYKLEKSPISKINNFFLEIIPEDFRIYEDDYTFYILVEYTIDFKKRSYGGRQNK